MLNRLLMSAAAAAALIGGPALAQTSGQTTTQGQEIQAQSGRSGTSHDGGGKAVDDMDPTRNRSDWQTGGANQGFNAPEQNAMNDQQRQQQQQAKVASQEEVRKTLKDAGFKNVRVQSAAYLVAATSPQGEPVMMLIDTNRMANAGGQGQARGNVTGGMPKDMNKQSSQQGRNDDMTGDEPAQAKQ